MAPRRRFVLVSGLLIAGGPLAALPNQSEATNILLASIYCGLLATTWFLAWKNQRRAAFYPYVVMLVVGAALWTGLILDLPWFQPGCACGTGG